MSRFALFLAVSLVAPAVAAQAAFDLSDPSLSLDDLPPGTVLSVEDLASIGITSDAPAVVAHVALPAAPSLGYDLSAALRASEKDVGIATIIGVLIPGGGQMYAGDTSKGLTILAIGYGSLLAGSVLTVGSSSALPYLLGFAGYVGATVYGVLQVPDDVQAANERNGFALAPAAIDTPVGMRPGVGASLRF